MKTPRKPSAAAAAKRAADAANTTDTANAATPAGIPEKLLTPVEPTLVANMERVVELLAELKYGDPFINAAKPYLAFVADKMAVTESQALMLSVFLEKSLYGAISMENITDMLGCRAIRVLGFMADVDSLIERKLIRREKKERYAEETCYYMPKKVIEAFKNNIVFTPKPTKGLTAAESVSDKNFQPRPAVPRFGRAGLYFCRKQKTLHI